MRGIVKLVIFLLALFVAINFLIYTDEQDWYKTQIGTGVQNCGPASAAMAIYWATGANVAVEQVRNSMGWPYENGAVAFYHIMNALKIYGIKAHYKDLESIEEIEKILEGNSIIIFWFYTGDIEVTDGSKYGRTYTHNGGHFAVIHDHYRRHFIVNDPMWGGRNRLYKKEQVEKFLEHVIVIERTYSK